MPAHAFTTAPTGRTLDAAEAAAVGAGIATRARQFRRIALAVLPLATGWLVYLLSSSWLVFIVWVVPAALVLVPCWWIALGLTPDRPKTTPDLRRPLRVVDGTLRIPDHERPQRYFLSRLPVSLPTHWTRVEGTGRVLVFVPVSASGGSFSIFLNSSLVVELDLRNGQATRYRSLLSDVTRGGVAASDVRFSHKVYSFL